VLDLEVVQNGVDAPALCPVLGLLQPALYEPNEEGYGLIVCRADVSRRFVSVCVDLAEIEQEPKKRCAH
jgi:hypothetical protein